MLIALKLLGSIALLIYGMKVMSEALQKMAGPQLRHLLGAMAGTWEVFYTDVCKTYRKMKAAGVDARLHVAEKMGHVYPLWPGHEGRKARREIAEIISNSPDSPSN